MLNLFLGIPRHVWLSPFELSQNPALSSADPHHLRGDGKSNMATDLSAGSLHQPHGGDLRQMSTSAADSIRQISHTGGIRSSATSSSSDLNQIGTENRSVHSHLGSDRVSNDVRQNSVRNVVGDSGDRRHDVHRGDVRHESDRDVRQIGNDGRTIRQIGNRLADIRQISSSYSHHDGRYVSNSGSGDVRQISGGGGGRGGESSSPSGSSIGSPPLPGSYTGSGQNNGNGNSSANVFSASSFPAMVTQAIQSIANASANVKPYNSRGPHGNNKYQCRRCDLVFLNKSAMQIHSRESHGAEVKPFQCHHCMKTFSTTHQLAQHNRIHTGEKPYKCIFCDRCFKQLSHLQQHMRLHTGERPYKCTMPDCNRSFIQLSNLNQHLRNHEYQTSKNRQYHCDICGKGFVAEVSLMTHSSTQHNMMSTATLLSCSVCHHMFASRESLMEHMHSKH